MLIPLVAMQFTNEVKWTISDFVLMAVLLFGTGLLCELVLRKVKKIKYKIIVSGIVLIGFVIVWIEMAVGIFGTPFAGT